MSESIDPTQGRLEPIRLPDTELDNLEASVRRLRWTSRPSRPAFWTRSPPNRSRGCPRSPAMPMPGSRSMPEPPPEPRFILALDGEEYEAELDALTDWVQDVLLDVYGAEVTTSAPWCQQWQEHLDVVGWLHALWMAYQQHMEPEAGLSGPAVWHRDFLTHTMAAVRAPGGPLSACMTDPSRPSHRLLPGPKAPTPAAEANGPQGVS